ncbi:MAG TPA: dioxygenase [Microvirga sp.]|nr:dioxygenase [Microvirga sp.]
MAQTRSPRLREITASFVRHMHAFAREVRLTEDEFEFGLDFLNRIGQATHDAHNEAVLFSDAIGFSTLVCLLNNGQAGATETASALLGPFWRMNSPLTENGGSIVRSPTPGPALFTECHITDPLGRPLEGVEVDVWQASPVGLYENQDETQADMNLRGKFITDEAGRFWFRSVKPAGYPVPTDGPVGDLLRAQGRHPYRPAHLHFLGFKAGYKTLITQVFADDDAHLESDVVFGVTRHLIGGYREGQGTPPASDVTGPWYRLGYTFVMEPGEAKLPVPPIK